MVPENIHSLQNEFQPNDFLDAEGIGPVRAPRPFLALTDCAPAE